MAHGITSSDSMFSVREKPWHGLGVVLPEPPKSIAEALTAAKLDWQVTQRPLYTPALDGASQHLEGDDPDSALWVPDNELVVPNELISSHVANFRSDTGKLLGIVGADFVPMQNIAAFEFLDAILGTELCFETAGSIWEGRRVWVLARLPEFIEVGGDQVGQYVFIANGHDGSLALTAAVTPVRVVCNNTLTWALSKSDKAPQTVKFRHTAKIADRWEEARKVMGLTVNYNTRFKELGDKLATEKLPEKRFRTAVLEDLFPEKEDAGDRAAANRDDAIEAVLSFFRGEGSGGDTSGNAPGTKWCAANAIAEYSDWGRRTTQATDQVYRSFNDGSLKQKGLKLVLAA